MIGKFKVSQDILKEKLLAAKPHRAIFAIPKNDVQTTHF